MEHGQVATVSLVMVLWKCLFQCVVFVAMAVLLVAGQDVVANRPVVRVVAYDRVRGFLNWLQDWFIEAARTQCPKTTCIITDNRREIKNADVILYHAPTHGKLPPLSKEKTNGAVRAFISMEQPKYAKFLDRKKYLQKNFDLISTYSLKSVYPGTNIPNLPLSYFPLNILSPDAVMQPAHSFGEKNGFGTGVTVAAFVSNCKNAGASGRAQYLKELMKYIDVHSYGGCLNNRQEPSYPKDPKWPQVAQKRARKIKVLSNYKFYLAFENYQVEDYVSEKVFESLIAGALPVYRGAPEIAAFMPANDSFIDANNLTPRELANKLENLKANEAEYNKYFDFKKRPMSSHFQEIALMSYTHPNVLCRMCEYALERRQKGNRE